MRVGRAVRISSILGAALSTAAKAQDAPSAATVQQNGLGEIVVTANRRSENLQQVPTSISTLSGKELLDRGITSTTDITNFVAGVQVLSVNSGTDNFFSIRGVTQNDYAEHQESPVAVYSDGVYLSQTASTATALFDTERVEVLRGPQGTLFGRNATGGLVQYISRKPSDVWNGYATTSYGNYDQNHTEGAIGGPMANGVSFRFATSLDFMSPYLVNTLSNRHNPGNRNSQAARLQLLIKPTDRIDILLNARVARENVRAGFYKWLNPYPDPNNHLLGTPVGNSNPWGTCKSCDILGYKVPSNYDFYMGAANVPGRNNHYSWGVSGTVDYHLGKLKITSITDITRVFKNYHEDSDSTPDDLIQFWTAVDSTQFSEEVHLTSEVKGRFRWVAGFYFLDIVGRYRLGNGYGSQYVAKLGAPLATPAAPAVEESYLIKTRSYAPFAQAELDVTPKLTLTLGGRWTYEHKDYYLQIYGLTCDREYCPVDKTIPTFFLNPAISGDDARIRQGDWAAKAALNWKITPNFIPYAAFNRGLKAGGFNAPDTVFSPTSLYKFGEEKLYAYEVGFKSEWFDRRLRVNADAFHYTYVGYQAINTVGLNASITNLPGKIDGGELEITAAPTKGLLIHEGLALLHARIYNFVLPDGTIATRTPVQAPTTSFIGDIGYSFEPARIGKLTLAADYSFRTKQFYQLADGPSVTQNAYWLVNAHLSYSPPNSRWQARLYVNNLADTKYLSNAIVADTIGFGQGVYGLPRLYGASVTCSF